MSVIPVEVRERVVRAYLNGDSGSFVQTARLFQVSEASVNRWVNKARRKESLAPNWKGGAKRSVDLEWLMGHATQNPDSRLIDRIADWETHSGRRVSVGAMWSALRAIGITHKKRRR